MSWIRALKLRQIFSSVLIGFFALELFSYFLVRSNLLLVNETPKLYQGVSSSGGNVSTNWWTEQELWGAWHKKVSTAQHTQSCFSAEYRSNSVGARDDEFVNFKKEKTYVLLGDSFAEGFGVNFDETAHRIIEESTTTKLLNFGTAGNFGPLQYWLIYDNLAKSYPHDGLIIFFLPSNDFTDNDYEYWTNTKSTYLTADKERYRPYYRQQADNSFDHFIPPNAVQRAEWGYATTNQLLKQFLVDNFWSSNVLRTAKLLLFSANLKDEGKENGGYKATHTYSGYFDPTDLQQQAAVYYINKIVSVSASFAKNILIVAIPTPADFERVALGQKRESMAWWRAFKDMEIERKKVHFLDLLDHPPHRVESLFFSCDGHWSPEGNKWAAGIISKSMREKF
jgi:hypothetical protein